VSASPCTAGLCQLAVGLSLKVVQLPTAVDAKHVRGGSLVWGGHVRGGTLVVRGEQARHHRNVVQGGARESLHSRRCSPSG
jgi:hypothetical protein